MKMLVHLQEKIIYTRGSNGQSTFLDQNNMAYSINGQKETFTAWNENSYKRFQQAKFVKIANMQKYYWALTCRQ